MRSGAKKSVERQVRKSADIYVSIKFIGGGTWDHKIYGANPTEIDKFIKTMTGIVGEGVCHIES